jgi:vancomycin resistance protein YoaR
MKRGAIYLLLGLTWLFFAAFADEQESEKDILLQKEEIDQYGMLSMEDDFIDPYKLGELMERLENKLYIAPKDAEIKENGSILAEQNGYTLDRQQFEIQFKETFYSDRNDHITVPLQVVYPRINEELLKNISSVELGNYTTYYKAGNKERTTNIQLSSESINSTVVFPGETFSFNEVVGERTEEKGYMKAPVIVKGEFTEDIGGGICQVSSTLFNAVDIEGIQIEERYAHSREVPYVPPGRDATVSWWGPDFVFKNMYNEPVLIRSKAEDGKVTVSVHSSDSAEHFTGNES